MTVKIYKLDSIAHRHVKKVVENPDVRANNFARAGYQLKDGASLGQSGCYILYIKADDDFFAKNEKDLKVQIVEGKEQEVKGIEELKGADFIAVKQKIEEEADNAAAGVGSVFSGF